MTDGRAGFVISIFFHVLVIAGLMFLFSRGTTIVRTINLDFTLLKAGEGAGDESPGRPVAAERKREVKVEQRTPVNVLSRETGRPVSLIDEETVTRRSAKADEAAPRGIASDAAGQVVIQGVAGGSGTAGKEEGRPASGADAVSTSALPGGGGRLLDYGRAGKVERDFSFIRDGVVRHVSYPDRARRMGWEGRVVLSFTVLEGGSVQDVRVTESSGHGVLDENARDAVIKARFSRKVPYRLTVVLPVEYRLE